MTISLALVSMVVPLGVFAFGDRFFGRRLDVGELPRLRGSGRVRSVFQHA